MENQSPNTTDEISGPVKMAGMTLIALAIPIGAGVAVRDIKRYGGEWAILLCFSIIVVMSALGFLLIGVSSKLAKFYRQTDGDSSR